MLPINNRASIHQGFNLLPFRQAIHDITQNMVSLNETMVLDTSVWWQNNNNIKGTHLFHSIVSSLKETAIFNQRLIVIKTKSRLRMVDSTPLIRSRNSITYAPVAYGPSTIEVPSTHTSTMIPDLKSTESITDPCAFMVFNTRSTVRQPVIFDTGASLRLLTTNRISMVP
jgi:hypothetical protein